MQVLAVFGVVQLVQNLKAKKWLVGWVLYHVSNDLESAKAARFCTDPFSLLRILHRTGLPNRIHRQGYL
jgi:hypothetical protein